MELDDDRAMKLRSFRLELEVEEVLSCHDRGAAREDFLNQEFVRLQEHSKDTVVRH